MNPLISELAKAWALKKDDKGILRVLVDALIDSAPSGATDGKWIRQQLGEMNLRWKVLSELKARVGRYSRDEEGLDTSKWRLARAKQDILSEYGSDGSATLGHGGFLRLSKGEVTVVSPLINETVRYLSFSLYRTQVADASLFDFLDGEVAEDVPLTFEGTPPKVELKKFTANQRLSEETLAFAAEVYVDGKKAGTVSNHGQGGSNDVHWLNRETEARVEAWLRTQIHVSSLDEHGQPIEGENALAVPEAYRMDEDFFFSLLSEAEMRKKEEKRIAAKRQKFIATAKARGSLPFVAKLGDRSELFFEMSPKATQSADAWVTAWAAKQKRKVAVVSVEALS